MPVMSMTCDRCITFFSSLIGFLTHGSYLLLCCPKQSVSLFTDEGHSADRTHAMSSERRKEKDVEDGCEKREKIKEQGVTER